MKKFMRRLSLIGISFVLLISLSGVTVLAVNLPTEPTAGGCAASCCPGSTEQDEPSSKGSLLECQCPSCQSAEVQPFALRFKSVGETGTVPRESSRRPPGEHPTLIDYPPELA